MRDVWQIKAVDKFLHYMCDNKMYAHLEMLFVKFRVSLGARGSMRSERWHTHTCMSAEGGAGEGELWLITTLTNRSWLCWDKFRDPEGLNWTELMEVFLLFLLLFSSGGRKLLSRQSFKRPFLKRAPEPTFQPCFCPCEIQTQSWLTQNSVPLPLPGVSPTLPTPNELQWDLQVLLQRVFPQF